MDLFETMHAIEDINVCCIVPNPFFSVQEKKIVLKLDK